MARTLKIDDGAEFDSQKYGERLINHLSKDLEETENGQRLQDSRQHDEDRGANDGRALRNEQSEDEADWQQDESSDELQESQEDVVQEELLDDTSEEDILQEAMKKGYDPNYKGRNRKTPEQFLRDGTYIDQISNLSKENKQMSRRQEELTDHISRLTKLLNDRENKTIDRDLAYHKEALKESYQDGDDTRIALIEQEIENLKQQKANLETFNQEPTSQRLSDEAQSFHQRNQHWLNDPSAEGRMMNAYAHSRDVELSNSGYSAAEVANQVEAELKQRFPHRFPRTGERREVPKVSATTERRSPKRSRAVKMSDLSPAQQDAARYFESMGLMTKEEYIKQLKDSGDL